MEPWLIRFSDYLFAQSWQIAVLTIAVVIASFLLRSRSAHVRYLLWLIVLAKALVPPLYSIPVAVLPQQGPPAYGRALPMAERMAAEYRVPEAAVTESPRPAAVQSEAASSERVIRRLARYDTRAWLAIGWLAGVVALSFYYLLNALRTQIWLQRRRKALPSESGGSIESFFTAHGVRRMPRVWLLDRISQPFVWGLVRGSIYLPAELLDGKHAKFQPSLLAHELSHVIRLDAMINSLQVLAQTVFWFHPFVWWANRKIRAEREKCCDEMTIARWNTRPEEYSEAIVETLAAKYEQARPVPSLAVGGQVKNIEERIDTMLKPGKKFYRRPSLVAAITLLMVAFLTVPTAIVLAVRAEAKTATESGDKRTKTLHEAAAAGDLERVQTLLAQGADVNEKDKSGSTPLHKAAHRWGHVAELLLTKGANVDATDAWGQTPLHLAATRAAGAGVRALLLAKGAKVNARDNQGNTPLHTAARSAGAGTADCLEFLLGKGADVNARNEQGQTPLHLVSMSRRPIEDPDLAASVLLAHGAEADATDKTGRTPLHVAAQNGQAMVVELLLAKGAVDKKTNDGLLALHSAVLGGHREVVTLLLARSDYKPSYVNATRPSGETALHDAAKAGYNEIAEGLIGKRADVNAKNARGETPAQLALAQDPPGMMRLLRAKGAEACTIQLAAYLGDLSEVKGYIAKGTPVDARDGSGLTALHTAAAAGQREVVEFLLAAGAAVNTASGAEGLGTPLHYAAHGGSKYVADFLVLKGTPVDARNSKGETPLHLAAQMGHTDLCRLLIAAKGDVNLRTQNGWTPLHYAADSGQKAAAALLLEKGADIDAKDRYATTPLDVGASELEIGNGASGAMKMDTVASQRYRDVIRFLVDKGADVSSPDLLYHVVCRGERELTEVLIKRGANVNTVSSRWGYPVSLYACWSGNPAVLELLLAHGANPNVDDEGWSLLHYEIWAGDVRMAKVLLDKGANPNYTAVPGCESPLQLAAKLGRQAQVELLITRGADPNLKDDNGQTPLSLAKEKGYGEIVEFLRQHGAKE